MFSFLKDINFKTTSWSEIIDSLLAEIFHFGVKLLVCIAIYIIGRKIIQYLHKAMGRMMTRRKFDPSIASFVRSLIDIALTATLLLIIVNILGINTTSFVALFASIGVAIGMALSGTLQNFAGGVMILLFRPFKVGDYILAQGQEGTVKAIQIFNTVIIASDNRTIFMPNGGLSANTITNYSNQKNRRVEWLINIGYGNDYEKSKKIIQDILSGEKRILSNPEPLIALKALNQGSIEIVIRAWTSKGDFGDVFFDINEKIYNTFTLNSINTSTPQLTVHLN